MSGSNQPADMPENARIIQPFILVFGNLQIHLHRFNSP